MLQKGKLGVDARVNHLIKIIMIEKLHEHACGALPFLV
jgi:hypothetical protein